MLGVSVRALRRQVVGTTEAFRLAVMPDALPEIGLGEEAVVQGQVTNLGDEGFLVSLAIEAKTVRECARCLAPVDHEIRTTAEEMFPPGSEQQDAGEERLDLEPLISEALVLEEPIRVLCREDCCGLCAHCGKNLNEGPCDCAVSDVDPRFEVLRQLVRDKEESR